MLYSNRDELRSQSIDPSHLIGLIRDDEEEEDHYERNAFNYTDDFIGKHNSAALALHMEVPRIAHCICSGT